MLPWTARSTKRLLAMHPRQLWFGLTLIALVACAHQPITVSPDPLQDLAPIQAQVDTYLLTLTERWATGGTSGEVRVGALFRQVLVDDPQAALRLTYVTSQLDVATVVSPRFYRPNAYVARYQLIVRVESPAIGMRQAWLQGSGESRSLTSAARATNDAIAQTVREFYRQLAAARDVLVARLMSR
jgi:hypothetical protein